MTRRRHALAALLAVALACAAPAAAVAQNAGDEQYADPFGKTPAKKKSSSGNQGSQQGPAGSSQPTTQSAPTAQASQPTASPSQTLPRTGFPAGLVAAAGTALLGGGAFLRRVTDAPR
jgi:LPXTG-motif cell wall-anchored protein